MAKRSLTSGLYRAARISNTVGALASGNPRRIARRGKNIVVGRALGRAGVWRRLWNLTLAATCLLAFASSASAAQSSAYNRYGAYQTMGQLPRDWHSPYPLVQGVPLVHYATFTARNPVTAAQYGLANYSLWVRDHTWLRWHAAQTVANWLVRTQTPVGTWPYLFTYTPPGGGQTFAPGWLSSLAQAQGISLLERVYHHTHARKYLNAINAALLSLETPVPEGGLLRQYRGEIYFEEYPTTRTDVSLNGDLQTLIGLYDVSNISAQARSLFRRGLVTLAHNISAWDSGRGFSYYSLASQTTAPPSYNMLIRAELRILTNVTGRRVFARYAARWTAS